MIAAWHLTQLTGERHFRTPHLVEATNRIALAASASRPEFLPSSLENRIRFEVEFPTIGLVEDRIFKLPSGTTSGYGGYVESLWGAPWRGRWGT